MFSPFYSLSENKLFLPAVIEVQIVDIREYRIALLGIDQPFRVDGIAAHRDIHDIERGKMILKSLPGIADGSVLVHDARPVRRHCQQ